MKLVSLDKLYTTKQLMSSLGFVELKDWALHVISKESRTTSVNSELVRMQWVQTRLKFQNTDWLGAVLHQYQNDILRVVAYGSPSLTPAEKNYHLHSGKLEFLVLKWAICDQFWDSLYYTPSFKVYTVNNPLTYVLSSTKPSTTSLHWVGELADFNFTIHYRPTKANIDADTWSWMPLDDTAHMETYTEIVSQDVLQTVVCAQQNTKTKAGWTECQPSLETILFYQLTQSGDMNP